MSYVSWSLLGMVAYSLVTLFVKLATRTGRFSGFLVLAFATLIVTTSTMTLALSRGDIQSLKANDFASVEMLTVALTGICLAVAVISLFRALSLGPSSVVVPVYGMFIVGGALLGVLVLHEPLTEKKVAGLTCAIVGVYLIASR